HPRFPVIPRLGMNLNPLLLAASSIHFIRSLHHTVGKFDLIDAHYIYPDGVAAVWIGKRLGLPVVLTARGTDVNLIPRHIIPRALIRSAIAVAAGLIAVSGVIQ